LKQLTGRQVKRIKYMFKEKDSRRKRSQKKFLHRSPSGDARKREPIIRMLAHNVEYIFIVSSFVMPSLKTGLIDRFLVMAEVEKVTPVIIFNKTDLLNSWDRVEKYLSRYCSLGYISIATSVVTGEGIEALRQLIAGNILALAGHSGVGKTSLLRALYPDSQENLETREVSLATRKGRHTTTTIKFHRMSDGATIFDLPGLKYVSLYDLAPVDLSRCFPEFMGPSRNCRFPDCIHNREPRCGVKRAVEIGIISRERYESYLRILDSILE